MVAHDRIGTKVNGKNINQQLDAVNDPLPTVLEIETRVRVAATKKGSAHAPCNAVVVGRVVQRDQAFPGYWHEAILCFLA